MCIYIYICNIYMYNMCNIYLYVYKIIIYINIYISTLVSNDLPFPENHQKS